MDLFGDDDDDEVSSLLLNTQILIQYRKLKKP